MGHALADEADLNAAEVFGPLRQNRYTVRLNVPWRWLWVLSFACRSLDVAALYKFLTERSTCILYNRVCLPKDPNRMGCVSLS